MKNRPAYRVRQIRFLITVIIALLASAFVVSVSNADSSIDPLSQTYFVAESDALGPLKFKRLYSSRTIFRGHFGAGWCSELDGRIQVYAGGETRYRGCDLETAAMLDSRTSARGVKKTREGFERRREDGAIQYFTTAGFLARIVRFDGEIRIHRDSMGGPIEIVTRHSGFGPAVETRYAVETDPASFQSAESVLIGRIGSNARFEYREGLLIKVQATHGPDGVAGSRYSYDDDLNMTVRMTDGLSETMVYDEVEDRVIQIVRRAAFERERLRLTLSSESSDRTTKGEIEMKIEVERGAETHPVRILYNRETRRMSLDGNRDAARRILIWIRA